MKLIYSILVFLFLANSIYADNINVKAVDTIAGYSTFFTSSKMEPLRDVTFQVIKPDGSTINLPSRSGIDGYATTELDGYHTKKAGLYQVSTATKYEDFGQITRFQVFADILSPFKSKILLDKPSLSAKTDRLNIRVNLKDKYENPIAGHIVKLISSRNEDLIKIEDNGITNENGIAMFTVSSDFEGVSIFTAIDQNLNQEINERQKVIFYAAEEKFSLGGNFSADLTSAGKADITAIDGEEGILDHFSIEFPDQVKMQSNDNYLTIIAKDKNDNTIKSYEGTIMIEVDDINATIPNEGEYTFMPQDQGKKQFAIAMVFAELGEKTITVYDYDSETKKINHNIKGTKTVLVTAQDPENINVPSVIDEKIEIKYPIDNQEYGTKDISVSGMAEANSNLKLMLDEAKVTDIAVDNEGFFSYFLQDIEDGSHTVYVSEIEGLRRSSKPVSFSVDATAPVINSIEMFPTEPVYPETHYTITIESEPKLDKVKIRVGGLEETLVESEIAGGKYEGTFFAPQNPGTYKIDVIMADKMGNDISYNNQKELQVIEKIIIKPKAPTNLLATAGDTKIDLTWDKSDFPSETEKTIDHYNIYVGETEYDLKIVMQSKTQSALISELKNDQEYVIAVSAVDNEKEESDKSAIIKSTPKKSIQNCSGNTYSSDGKEPCTICTSPNEVNFDHTKCLAVSSPDPVIPNPVIPEPIHPAAEPLRAIAGDSKVTLLWDYYDKAFQYKIFVGIKSKKYEVEIITSENVTSEVVKDLINELPYYFTVSALDESGREIKSYPEVKATPSGYGFLVVPPKKTIGNIIRNFSKDPVVAGNPGPETTIFIVISFLLATIFLGIKKIKAIQINHKPIKRVGRLQF